jgi:hypothetical protein
MLIKTSITLIMMISSLYAAQIQIKDPCQTIDFISDQIQLLSIDTSVGKITEMALEKSKINYQLNSGSLLSVQSIPSENQKIQIINDYELNAFGWCYKVNDEIPMVLPDDFILKNSDKINWYIGFTSYNKGNWGSMCLDIESNLAAKKYFCEDYKKVDLQ